MHYSGRDYVKDAGEFDPVPKKGMKIKDWYLKNYADDPQGIETCDSNMTFQQLYNLLIKDRSNLYKKTGIRYGIVKDRFVTALESLFKLDPGEITGHLIRTKAEPSERLLKYVTEGSFRGGLNVDYAAIKNEVAKQAKALFKSQDHESTHWVPLGKKDGNRWAVVLAWQDYDNEGKWQVYGKVAFQPTNSVMQEYDIDWMMPEYNGETSDTEISFTTDSIPSSSQDLVDYWKWIVENLLKDEEIEESVMTESCEFNDLVMSYVLEGRSIQEAITLAEDTITPQMIDKLEQTPGYKKILRDVEYYFNACDGIEGYRDGDFKAAPIDSLEDEADFCQETADFLGSLQFKGFKPEVQKELVQATVDDMEYLDRSALRLKNLLKKQDDSMYLNPDGSVNKNTNQKPGEYARRALRKIRDLFARLGQSWDFDPDFDYKSLPDVDYRHLVADYESKDWKQGLMNVVHTAMSEGICDKNTLLSISESLNLPEEQAEFFTHYVYYILD